MQVEITISIPCATFSSGADKDLTGYIFTVCFMTYLYDFSGLPIKTTPKSDKFISFHNFSLNNTQFLYRFALHLFFKHSLHPIPTRLRSLILYIFVYYLP